MGLAKLEPPLSWLANIDNAARMAPFRPDAAVALGVSGSGRGRTSFLLSGAERLVPGATDKGVR